MPMEKSAFATKCSQWLRQLPEQEQKNFQKSGQEHIFCNVCSKIFKWTQKGQLDQHVSTSFHIAQVKRTTVSRQMPINDVQPIHSFNKDLCTAFLAADIPFGKLNNPILKSFLGKYCDRPIPSPWTLRNNNVEKCYQDVINKVRVELMNKYVWMGIDETTDKCGRFVANVIVGRLDGTESKPHLIMSVELEVANNVTVTQLIRDALHFLWPEKKEAEVSKQFAVLLSDAAPYMVKTGKNLKKTTFPGLLHVTCVAHGLHRVAETVRSSFKNVDKLIGCVKAVFRKSPYRTRMYNEMLPGISLPPEPVLTRWGTWLEAAGFLSENFTSVGTVINSFDPDDAECVKKAQDLLAKQNIAEELADISSNFVFIASEITKLETRNLTIMEAVDVLTRVKSKLALNNSRVALKVKNKFTAVMDKNKDLETLVKVVDVLRGNSQVTTGLEPSLISSLKYCPLTSVELERGFSMEKALLSDRRRNFSMKNLEMYLVCHFEMSVSESS